MSSFRAVARSPWRRVQNDARVPVFAHHKGMCHIYLDAAAELEYGAAALAVNSKMRRTGTCGAPECCWSTRRTGKRT